MHIDKRTPSEILDDLVEKTSWRRWREITGKPLGVIGSLREIGRGLEPSKDLIKEAREDERKKTIDEVLAWLNDDDYSLTSINSFCKKFIKPDPVEELAKEIKDLLVETQCLKFVDSVYEKLAKYILDNYELKRK